MKKYLIVFAALACVFAGCKKDVAVSGIAINPDKIEKYYIGDTVKLGLIVNPDGAKFDDGVKVVWTSSDEDVVAIVSQNGLITADYPGDAVVKATAGQFSGACQIHANYEPLFWNIGTISYFPSTKSAEPLTDSIFVYGGVKCKLFSVTFIYPNANDFNEDYSAGEGYCLFAKVAAPFPIEGSKEDQEYVSEEADWELKLVTTEEEWKVTPFSAFVGELDPEIAGPIYQDYLEKIDAGDQSAKPDWDTFSKKAIKGAYIAEATFHEGGSVTYSYVPAALMKEGYIKLESTQQGYRLDYDVTLQWIVSGFWGLLVDWEAVEETESLANLLVKPYQLCEPAMVHYDIENEEGQFIDDEEEEGGEGEGGEGVAPKRATRKASKLLKRNILTGAVQYNATAKRAK